MSREPSRRRGHQEPMPDRGRGLGPADAGGATAVRPAEPPRWHEARPWPPSVAVRSGTQRRAVRCSGAMLSRSRVNSWIWRATWSTRLCTCSRLKFCRSSEAVMTSRLSDLEPPRRSWVRKTIGHAAAIGVFASVATLASSCSTASPMGVIRGEVIYCQGGLFDGVPANVRATVIIEHAGAIVWRRTVSRPFASA
jgi:hypothetical protein